jgi:hypothetical protein
MGLACLTGGILAKPVIGFLFGVDVSVAGAYYLEKALIFAATVGAAVLIYLFGVRKAHFLDRIKNHHVAFNDIAVGMLVYFVATGVFLYFVSAGA